MYLGRNSDRITLCSDENRVSSKRSAVTGIEAFILFAMLLLALLLDFLGIVGIVLAGKCAVVEKNTLCYIMTAVLILAISPALLVTIIVQGLLFRFSASYDRRTGLYRIQYGLLSFRKVIVPEKAIIKIEPAYYKGDWGYRAKIIAVNKRFSIIFIPSSTIGERKKAYSQALEISYWLQRQGIVTQMDARFEKSK
jgi:membrane-bound metal-dependent hydrolase YbcI (DUF457 family)